mgnify:CR=1 FL=1
MAVCRVHKTKDYTLMSNCHLRDKELSCKACGLLSKMLSLPEEWDYTTRGLAAICKDGVDSISSALKELEQRGYLVRTRLRDDKGRITDVEYNIYETPQPPAPDTDSPHTENPDMDMPDTASPCLENPAQYNTNKSNTQKENTHESITHSFFPSSSPSREPSHYDGMNDGMSVREEIQEQIDYDILSEQFDRPQLDELVEIMVEVAMNRSRTIKIGRDAEYPTEYVQDRFRKLDSMHIEKVLDGLKENTTRVYNTKAYLMAALFNVVSTIDNHYAMLVNHDFYGG